MKSVELTCNRQPTTTTHDISPVLARLPQDWEITEDLKAAWATVPGVLKVYTAILYRGLNQHTGTQLTSFYLALSFGKYEFLSKYIWCICICICICIWILCIISDDSSDKCSTGEDPREFLQQHAEDIREAIVIAERDFLQFAEKHLEKFENDNNQ